MDIDELERASEDTLFPYHGSTQDKPLPVLWVCLAIALFVLVVCS